MEGCIFFSSGWRRSVVGRSHAGEMLSAAVLDYGSSIRSIFFHTFGLLKPCFYERLNFFFGVATRRTWWIARGKDTEGRDARFWGKL